MKSIYSYPLYSRKKLKKFLNSNEVWFRKNFGQNFLVERYILEKIENYFKTYCSDDVVYEIGGGSGNLSLIISKYASKQYIFEIDNFFISYLHKLFNLEQSSLLKSFDISLDELKKDLPEPKADVKIISGNFLKWKDDEISSKVHFAGNIPYNISSPIIKKLSRIKDNIKQVFLTTQKEYFERMIGKDDKSFLTIFVQYHFEITPLFPIPSGCFYPSPKVNSYSFFLTPKPSEKGIEDRKFEEFVSTGFAQKRKKLSKNIINFVNKNKDIVKFDNKNDIEDLLEDKLGNRNIRAEELDVKQWVNLYKRIVK